MPRYHSTVRNAVCPRCGTSFTYHPRRYRRYCSNECRYFSQHQTNFMDLLAKETNECVLWAGTKAHNGYGRITWKGSRRPTPTHRLAWTMKNGSIPKGLRVCHRCDTPACMNTRHLFLGTDKDNQVDCSKKNRRANGQKNGNAKLSNKTVAEIRAVAASGVKVNWTERAKELGVCPETIWLIVRGKTWVDPRAKLSAMPVPSAVN